MDDENWFSTFTINRGTDDGIQVDCNVITEGGLVGIVTEVEKAGLQSDLLLMIPATSAL